MPAMTKMTALKFRTKPNPTSDEAQASRVGADERSPWSGGPEPTEEQAAEMTAYGWRTDGVRWMMPLLWGDVRRTIVTETERGPVESKTPSSLLPDEALKFHQTFRIFFSQPKR